MVLDDSELQQVYEFFLRADLAQLTSLCSLGQQLLSGRVKDGDDRLFLMLDFYEKDKVRRGGRVE